MKEFTEAFLIVAGIFLGLTILFGVLEYLAKKFFDIKES
jgi:hypothetical protein